VGGVGDHRRSASEAGALTMSEHAMFAVTIGVLGILGSWLAHLAGKQAARIGDMDFELVQLRALTDLYATNKRHRGQPCPPTTTTSAPVAPVKKPALHLVPYAPTSREPTASLVIPVDVPPAGKPDAASQLPK